MKFDPEEFTYTEFEFDSLDCTTSSRAGATALDTYNNAKNTPSFVVGKPLDNIAYIKVLEAQIPASFYTFNALNNVFLLVEFYDDGGVVAIRTVGDVPFTVTIPVGNYNSTTICAALKTALDESSAAITDYNLPTVNGVTRVYTVTFSNVTGKISIVSDSAGVNCEFVFISTTLTSEFIDGFTYSPFPLLGGNVGPAYVDFEDTLVSTSSVPYTLEFPNVANLTGPFYIYLCSQKLGSLIDLYLPGNGVVNRSGGGADGPQMAKIPMVTAPGQVTNWIDPCPEKWFPVPEITFGGQVDFFCTLGLNTPDYPIDFNGLGFSFKLGMQIRNKSVSSHPGGGADNGRVVTRTWANAS